MNPHREVPEGATTPERQSFRKELEHLINCHSQENGCNTPDFILADYLANCLLAFDTAVNQRERWYSRKTGWRKDMQSAEMDWLPAQYMPANSIPLSD